jgi:hypothetical protein
MKLSKVLSGRDSCLTVAHGPLLANLIVNAREVLQWDEESYVVERTNDIVQRPLSSDTSAPIDTIKVNFNGETIALR